jgi:hypothetical protein
MYKFDPGYVSEGTLRREDLIPKFIDLVLDIDPNNEFANDRYSVLEHLEEEGVLDDYWDSEESYWDLAELIDELDSMCHHIPGMYFGAHPDDGACFGFWNSDDWGNIP